MSRIVYLNGQYLSEDHAQVSIFDRGFLMADGIYEVTAVLDGKLADFPGHIQRLQYSLEQLEIANPHPVDQWLEIHRSLVTRNRLERGLVYLQITRGNPGDRDFLYPPAEVTPTVVLFTQSKPQPATDAASEAGWRVISLPDLRWGRCDVKTTQLLYASMGKMLARRAGADDAWLVRDGQVTEGTSNNAYLVHGQRLITRPPGHDILRGTTRMGLLQLASQIGLKVEQRGFSIAEAQAADEAFVTSASIFVMPVIAVDGQAIGDGRPGPWTLKLRERTIGWLRDNAI